MGEPPEGGWISCVECRAGVGARPLNAEKEYAGLWKLLEGDIAYSVVSPLAVVEMPPFAGEHSETP